MTAILTSRPRNVDTLRAAAILYGDLGTSKAYVLGLAFAVATYSSFWYLAAIALLTFIVGISYVFICKVFPSGGGVYTSAKARSRTLAMGGAFFIISDYIVTAALSSVSAFHYLDVPYPEYWAMFAIILIGLLNFLGPKHTGSLALALALPTILVIIMLGLFSVPFLPKAINKLQPVSSNLITDWNIFVGIIVALSGIESIANTTSTMQLDPGATARRPLVTNTSTPAILMVIFEVCLFTMLLGLAMNALPGLQVSGNDVSAPGYPNVRDAMLRYMAEVFGGTLFGEAFGQIFAYAVTIVIALLLLSAVNTSLIALISLFFILSRDGEIPKIFQKLNQFGDPIYATFSAFILPVIVLLFVSDISGLANLYAIGFVGAIAINLMSTSTNFTLPLKIFERGWMIMTFIIMAAVEATLFIDKPDARNFVFAVIGLGLILHFIAKLRKEKAPEIPKPAPVELPPAPSGGIMVALTGKNRALDYALELGKTTKEPLHILFLREQRVVTEHDRSRSWSNDKTASDIFNYAAAKGEGQSFEFLYSITAHTVQSIVEIAKEKKVKRLVICKSRGTLALLHLLRGTTIKNISRRLPKEIDLIIIY